MVSEANIISSNVNNEVRSIFVAKKLQIIIILSVFFLWICQNFIELMRFFILLFKIGAHGAFKKLLDTQMIDEKVYSVKHFLILSRFIFMHSLPE